MRHLVYKRVVDVLVELQKRDNKWVCLTEAITRQNPMPCPFVILEMIQNTADTQDSREQRLVHFLGKAVHHEGWRRGL